MQRIRLAVALKGVAEPVEVTVTNPAMVRWDFDRIKHGWPKHSDAPSLFSTYLAWASLVDLGEYPGETKPETGAKTKPVSTFARFRDEDCLHIDDLDDGLADAVDPTQTAAESGPASP